MKNKYRKKFLIYKKICYNNRNIALFLEVFLANHIEQSVYGKWSKINRWGSLAMILSGLLYELYCYLTTKTLHLDVSFYCLIFLVVWICHLACDYTYIYTGKELIVEKKSFGVTNVCSYKITDIEGLVKGFKKNMLKKEAGVRYISRFSWADDHPVHLIILKKDHYPTHIMIKASNGFFEKIQQKQTEKFPDASD